ncbi:MAG: RNA 3'-terminal phosphate cyclase [Thermoplasmata archaeon]
MLEIDGSYGEGGGQIVRTSAAFALITQQTVRIKNIRAKRERGGLRPQHLAALKLLTLLSETKIEGLGVGAKEVVILPGNLRGGKIEIDIGTAGSIALLLQTVVLPFVARNENLELRIVGGTDVTRAPTMDYVKEVLLPVLRNLGVEMEVGIEQRGFYPAGGGIVTVKIGNSGVRNWVCTQPEGALRLQGKIVCSQLPEHVPARMKDAVLRVFPDKEMEFSVEWVRARCPGVSLTLWGNYRNTVLGSSAVGEKGVPAEQIGEECADELKRNLANGCTIDAKMADQILPFLAVANGSSEFTTKYVSQHARTVAWVIEQFLARKIEFVEEKERVLVRVR